MIVETVRDLLLADSAIAALVGDRIYPVELPDGTTFPAVVVSKATGLGDYTLDGDSGLEDSRVQIDSYAVTYEAAIELKTAIRRNLSGRGPAAASGNPCAIQGAFCINDSDLPASAFERSGPRLRRRMLEFRIWNSQI